MAAAAAMAVVGLSGEDDGKIGQQINRRWMQGGSEGVGFLFFRLSTIHGRGSSVSRRTRRRWRSTILHRQKEASTGKTNFSGLLPQSSLASHSWSNVVLQRYVSRSSTHDELEDSNV